MRNTTVFVALVWLVSVTSCVSNPGKQPVQPNIIFILSDDHTNNAIGAYGNTLAETPNIDRIAAEGAIFTNFFVTNSICGPSRAALLTGQYSHKNGFTANDRQFDTDQFLFSRSMADAGYQTAWIGKWHLGTLPGDAFDHWHVLPGQGFYFNPFFIDMAHDTVRYEGYVTDVITRLATNWLNQRQPDQPFFLVVGEKATHREWLPDIPDLGAYDHIEFPLPSTFYDDYSTRKAAAAQDMAIAETMRLETDLKVDVDYDTNWVYRQLNAEQREAYQTYYQGQVSKTFHELNLSGTELHEWKFQRYMRDYLSTANSLDRNIGAILEYLEENGLAENTIVVYGSDQGFYLGEHGWFDKRFMYEESLRTPFVMRYPDVVKPGTRIDQSVLNIDWAPTLLDVAGVEVPETVQGQSLLPILEGKNEEWRDAVYYHYYEYPDAHRVMPHFGIRTDRYKLVRFYGDQDFWELFDLEEDPNELRNIYPTQGSVDIIDGLTQRLLEMIEVYEDTDANAILQKEQVKR